MNNGKKNVRQRKEAPAEMYPCYFAAANGYDGFRSDFGTLFASEGYRRIFVLKGGPGTGKSTLMRRLADHGRKRGYSVTCILCSSDITSLDGVILESDAGRCAVVDGTAPHERDAVIPGAIDSLVDLGTLWNTGALIAARERILALNKEKKTCYADGYAYLAISGYFDEKTEAETVKIFSSPSFSFPYTMQGEERIARISAFGRDGYLRLNTLDRVAETRYTVIGKYGSEFLWLAALRSYFSRLGEAVTVCRHPLSGRPEAIFQHGSRTLWCAGEQSDGSATVDSAACLDATMLAGRERMLSFLTECRDRAIAEAVSCFSAAASLHAELEKIYAPAMDFTPMEGIFRELTAKIDGALG